ncbi:MAG TPA: hypothetical protein VFQ45_04695, partial [Longimicrobium sp.]|nr:hypothetical protein [Longimicrobium sp.]
ANRVVEHFPVGRSLAFDTERGRLWAVCLRCARWNLAPLEERWEAIEAAEKLFRDCRVRVQSENIGLARLRDGTRLVRVGAALPGELAVWRYAGRLEQRRRRALLSAGVGIAGVAVLGGLAAAGVVSGAFVAGQAVTRLWPGGPNNEVARYPRGVMDDVEVVLRRSDLHRARLGTGADGSLELRVPRDVVATGMMPDGRPAWTHTRLDLRGAEALAVLRRGLVELNHRGAGRTHVLAALDQIAAYGSAGGYLEAAGRRGELLAPQWEWGGARTQRLSALEMALNDEDERRALEGDLAELEAAWRRAEEIAAIADRLPDG